MWIFAPLVNWSAAEIHLSIVACKLSPKSPTLHQRLQESGSSNLFFRLPASAEARRARRRRLVH